MYSCRYSIAKHFKGVLRSSCCHGARMTDGNLIHLSRCSYWRSHIAVYSLNGDTNGLHIPAVLVHYCMCTYICLGWRSIFICPQTHNALCSTMEDLWFYLHLVLLQNGSYPFLAAHLCSVHSSHTYINTWSCPCLNLRILSEQVVIRRECIKLPQLVMSASLTVRPLQYLPALVFMYFWWSHTQSSSQCSAT